MAFVDVLSFGSHVNYNGMNYPPPIHHLSQTHLHRSLRTRCQISSTYGRRRLHRRDHQKRLVSSGTMVNVDEACGAHLSIRRTLPGLLFLRLDTHTARRANC